MTHPGSFQEIRALVHALPDVDSPSLAALKIHHPRIALFAGTHGFAGESDVSATRAAVQQCLDGGGALQRLCAAADADLRVYELDLDHPTADFRRSPAMSEPDCARAIAYGMMAIEPGVDVIGVGSISPGGAPSAAAIAYALCGGKAGDWLAEEAEMLESALQRYFVAIPSAQRDAFEVLRCFGGFEIAALCGAILAARLARQPVLLDNYAAAAAAAILFYHDARLVSHCLGLFPALPGHAQLLNRIGLKALENIGLQASEPGINAAMAIPMLQNSIGFN